jgi:hypothetical protein
MEFDERVNAFLGAMPVPPSGPLSDRKQRERIVQIVHLCLASTGLLQPRVAPLDNVLFSWAPCLSAVGGASGDPDSGCAGACGGGAAVANMAAAGIVSTVVEDDEDEEEMEEEEEDAAARRGAKSPAALGLSGRTLPLASPPRSLGREEDIAMFNAAAQTLEEVLDSAVAAQGDGDVAMSAAGVRMRASVQSWVLGFCRRLLQCLASLYVCCLHAPARVSAAACARESSAPLQVMSASETCSACWTAWTGHGVGRALSAWLPSPPSFSSAWRRSTPS